MSEKRRSKRMDINVTIKLNELNSGPISESVNRNSIEVVVVNISKDGLAFRSEEKLELNTFYDANVILWTKETVDTVIEIVRMENLGNEPTLYGCRFIGMLPADQLKIQIYEMVSEMEN